jgi:membrane dipeptidase
MFRNSRFIPCALIVTGVAFFHHPVVADQATQDEAALVARAKAIHERVITLDTHNDISPNNFQWSRNYTQDLGNQVNLPKMKAGGLDVSFMIVYVGQSNAADAFEPAGFQRAYDDAIEKFEAVHRLTKVLAPDQIELALSPADVVRIAKSGKKVAVIGIENGYPIGTNLGRVKEFWERGGRYMSLAHNGHSQLSDSNTGDATKQWAHEDGLSPARPSGHCGNEPLGNHGRRLASVERLDDGGDQTVESADHRLRIPRRARSAITVRNMDDEQLKALKANGGVIQAVAFASYVKCDPVPARAERRDRCVAPGIRAA